MITVGNKRDGVKGIYVGRPTVLGNPFAMKGERDRSIAIDCYRQWLWDEMRQRGRVFRAVKAIAERHLRGDHVVLVCWCAPKPCHADVIKAAAEWLASVMRPAPPAAPRTKASDTPHHRKRTSDTATARERRQLRTGRKLAIL